MTTLPDLIARLDAALAENERLRAVVEAAKRVPFRKIAKEMRHLCYIQTAVRLDEVAKALDALKEER